MADDETIARLTQERDEAEAALLGAVEQAVRLYRSAHRRTGWTDRQIEGHLFPAAWREAIARARRRTEEKE